MNAKPLFVEGNGRVTCADLACAGMTAHFSKMTRDLNGAAIEPLTPEAAREFAPMLGAWPTCEGCGAGASLVVAA